MQFVHCYNTGGCLFGVRSNTLENDSFKRSVRSKVLRQPLVYNNYITPPPVNNLIMNKKGLSTVEKLKEILTVGLHLTTSFYDTIRHR